MHLLQSNVDLNMIRSVVGPCFDRDNQHLRRNRFGNEAQNASVLRETASEKGETRSIMAAQQRHPIMVVRVQRIFSPATRRESLGKHLKGGRRGGGLKIDWTKPPD